MKFNRKYFIPAAILIILASLVLAGCGSEQVPANPQIGAINSLRTQLELPKLPLEYVETTFYSNSPSGNLQVEVYQDTQGRKFFVDPISNLVVEMDARALLDKISPLASVLSEEQVRVKAQKLIAAAIPGFETLRINLRYEEGGKTDNYFFTWYDDNAAGSSNPSRAQIALHRTGLLFGYENTLTLDK
jgi:hypothetical protein